MQVGLTSNLGENTHLTDFHDMSDKLWYLVALGENEDDLQLALFGQGRQQLLQLIARLGIESDKRIVHDQHTGIGKERGG